MGNCIIRQNKDMQTVQEVAQHNESMKVHQVLKDVLPLPSMEFNKNHMEIEAESQGGIGVMRIKLVITKQELEVMMKKGGVSVGDLVSYMKNESSNEAAVIEDEDNRNCGRWKPVLDSIPELS